MTVYCVIYLFVMYSTQPNQSTLGPPKDKTQNRKNHNMKNKIDTFFYTANAFISSSHLAKSPLILFMLSLVFFFIRRKYQTLPSSDTLSVLASRCVFLVACDYDGLCVRQGRK